MHKKICFISGSPRKNGNSEKIISFLSNGKDCEIIKPHIIDFHFCTGCEYCRKEKKCIYEDAFMKNAKKILIADTLVIVSPIYFYHLPSPLKKFIDRFQFFFHHPVKREKRKAFIILYGATNGKKLFDGAILTLNYVLKYISYHIEKTYLFKNICKIENTLKNLDDLKEELWK